MKKMKFIIVFFVYLISSLFYINGIYAFITINTSPAINQFSVEQNTSYTVIHELMNLDGTTYTEYSSSHYTDVPIGTVVSPAVLTLDGFTSPSVQMVTLNTYENTVITYRYTRNQYTLTINDSGHVTTSTPSGTYYYGQEIHLTADADDGSGCPFVKWTNDVTNRDYTFLLTENTTIGPIYADSYTITYVPNNGDSPFTEQVIQHDPIRVFPDVSFDDCAPGTGSYHELGCTYVYQLLGWYKEPNFINKVDETFIPTQNTTLYAKWNKVYFEQVGQVEYTGNNYTNTEVMLFNAENARKDFIVTFTVDEYTGFNPTNNSDSRGTIFTDMNESGAPYYGVHFYHDTEYVVNVNSSAAAADRVKNNATGYVTGQKVVFKRENGVIYYSYDDGPFVSTVNFSSFTAYYDVPATFGAGIKNNEPYRFLIGKISNMSVEIIEPDSYTIHFDANGGTGFMVDQKIEIGESTNITPNAYSNDDASFAGWNTAADGSGTSYTNGYSITSDLANSGETITLYAQWIPAQHFYVHFDANGGTGTMNNQRFVIGNPASPLTQNAFTRANYEFRGWNTAADGSGTHYDDEEAVYDLSNVDEDTVTLYAEWWKIQYIHTGDAIFDGTQNTFIDTGVNVFSNTNLNKDFEIRLTFKSVDSDQFTYTKKQPTILNVKDELNAKAPGFNLRFQNTNTQNVSVTGKWTNTNGNAPVLANVVTSNAPIDFVFNRKGGVITVKYYYNNYESNVITVLDQSSWTLNQAFSTNVAFGGYFDGSNNNAPGRFFKGTLSDMIILMDD